MNELRKSEDNQNREELKVLALQHSNKDELQRFAMFVLLMYPWKQPYCNRNDKGVFSLSCLPAGFLCLSVFFFFIFFFTPVCLSPLVSPFFPFSSLLFFLYSFFFLRLFLQQLNSHEWRMGLAYELVSCELSSHILFGVSVVWLLRLLFFCSPLPKLRRSGIRKSSCFYFRFRCNWAIWKFEPISTFFPRVSWLTFAF